MTEAAAGVAVPLAPTPIARGRRGAVVAPHHLATAAGLEVLRRGGHAVDAAIATNAVLAVVVPGGCGIGGDAFWLVWDAAERRQLGLNGSGRAPSGADPARLRAEGLTRLPPRGPLTITVPGAVRSWGDAHARWGRLSRAEVLGPAIDLARNGFAASAGFAGSVERMAAIVEPQLGPDCGFLQVFRPNRQPWRTGEVVRFPALAGTLQRLAADGFEAFYEGELAERQAKLLAAEGAPFAASDFHDHRSTWTEPIATDYRGTRVTTHPPNSAGIVALEILNILEAHPAPWPGSFGPSGPTDVDWIHRGIEASKLAMADRDLNVTDPEARDIPVSKLLDKERAHGLADLIDPEHAALPPPATNPPGGGTIYLAVVDGEGNAVSLIESNWAGFGSGLADPETGIHYQNRGAFFSLDENHPNVLAPGKRTLHTLVPGMLFRADRPWVVAGSMGGDAQPQIHAQIVSALVDGAVDIRTAIAAPRWFVGPRELLTPPVDVYAEPRFEAGVLEGLEALGHPVVRTGPFDAQLGHAHAIELVDGGPAAGGSVAAVTDPRSEGLPAAW